MKYFYYIILFFTLFLFNCQSKENQNENRSIASDSVSLDKPKEVNKKWEGTWEREGSIDPATLTISNVSYSSFDFYLSSHDGLKAGELSGKAVIEENMALFLIESEKDTCSLNFILQDSILVLNQPETGCSLASGINFTGEYFDDRYFKEKVLEEEAASRTDNAMDN